jgi:hypothetical protein
MKNDLHEYAHEVWKRRQKILSDFAEAYLASEFDGKDLVGFLSRLQLNQKQILENGVFNYQFWFSLRDLESE